MKRLLSICFACILVFNLCGYRLLIHVLEQQQQTAVAARINAGVADAELISVKVPVTLPYYTNAKEFQWVSGRVTLDGTVYQFVKRRIYNDSIEYLCLRDAVQTRLLSARDRFFSLVNDLDQKKSSPAPSVKPLLLEYCAWSQPALAPLPEVKRAHQTPPSFTGLSTAFILLPSQPPEPGVEV